MTTKVGLDYPVIPAGHEVWMVRPGAEYRLYYAFKAASAIAPDIPLLNIPDGISVRNNKDLVAQIRRGIAWRDWEKDGSRSSTGPSKSIRDYQLNTGDGLSNTRAYNAAVQILDDIPEGSLIFVPGHSLADNALLGIAASPSANRVPVIRQWSGGELSFLGRPLLEPIEVPMRLLPQEVVELRKNRSTVTSQIENYNRTLLYREYFQSFSLEGGDSYAQFRGGDTQFPADALSTLAILMRFTIEARDKVEAAGSRQAVKNISINEIASLAWETNSDLLIHARVNSPFGRVTFQSCKISIFAAVALVALAELDADAQVIHDLENSKTVVTNVCQDTVNSVKIAKDDAETVQQTLYDFYAIFGARTCSQVLEAARETLKSTQGQVDAVGGR